MTGSSNLESGLGRRSHSSKSDYSMVPLPPCSSRSLGTVEMMDDEVRRNVTEFSNQDNSAIKTSSRIFVEKYLLQFKWYNPHRDNKDMPNLKEGWAFYEHVTLARRKVGAKDNEARLQRALPGETCETELYNYWLTPESSFKDWGVGVALYLSTAKIFAIFLFIGGLLSLRNIAYFSSSDYDEQSSRGINNILLRGSAICNSTYWVECETGYCENLDENYSGVTYAYDKANSGKVFVERSACPISDSNDNDIKKAGYWNMAVQIMLIFMTILFSIYQGRQQTVIDEDLITASDYAIQVLNPPKDAYDPDEWKDYFNIFVGEKGVTLVTIILNNAPLLKALRERRYFRKELQRLIPSVDLDSPNLSASVANKAKALQEERKSLWALMFNFTLRPILRLFKMCLDPEVLMEKIEEKTQEIKELQKQDYDVSSVIVTFETESGKKTALEALSESKADLWKQRTQGKRNLFRGELMLDIMEPSEPSAIRYLNIDVPLMKRTIQFTITLIITLGLVALCGLAVARTRAQVNAFAAGILTTFFNIIIPQIVNLLLLIETHAREDDRQRSLYIKVTIFRWVNTAIATKFAVPFTSTLGNNEDDLLVGISGILLAEIWFSPLLSFLDIMGNVNKHYFAPRATVKEHMFLCFKGTNYNLADKYTDITKIIFVCYYYSALNPTLLFMGAVVLIVRYLSDKFCLLRLWNSATNVGTQVAEFSRKYFISLAVVASVIVSAYDWALINFDRVCDGKTAFENSTYDVIVHSKYGGVFNKSINTTNIHTPERGEPITIPSARVCKNDTCCQKVGLRWPPIPSEFEVSEEWEWMTKGQREVTSVYGWFSVVVLVGWLVLTFGHTALALVKSWVIGGINEAKFGKDQKIDFSNMEIDGYIPQIHDDKLTFPIISCDIQDIPESMLGFLIPEDDDIKNYNLIYDIPLEDAIEESNGGPNKKRHVFDVVKYWPYGESE